LGASTNIPATIGLIIGASGVLDMAGYSQTVGSLTGVAGSLVTSSASGSLVLTTGDATNTSYEGSIENGSGTIGLVKNGSGTWRLSGSSSYTGTTILNAGIINVSHSSGLGMSSLVSVANGSELQLQNNVSIPALPLRLTGSGIMNNTGALRNISGDNSWAGTITLITLTATIISDAGTLSLMAVNSINSPSNISLTFSGIGNINVLGSISTGTGALRKISEGTVTLSGVNTYTGLTSIIGGILKLGASHIINDLSPLSIGGGHYIRMDLVKILDHSV
jgi:autotransporter-associated beta strand protein